MPFREFEENIDTGKNNVGFGIDLTNKCNMNCPTCFYVEDPRNRVLDILTYAARFDFNPLILVTNGIRLANEDFARKVAETGAMVAVQRHVIGNGEEESRIQDVVMGVPNTLPTINKAFENIEEYFSPDKVAVQCCITKPIVESEQLYEVFRYAKQNGFEQVIECTKSGTRFERGNVLDISPTELREVYQTLQKIDKEEFGINVENLSPQAYGKTCHMPETGVHCLIDGTIVPCVGQQVPLGNIFKGDQLRDILQSSKRKFFQDVVERIEGYCKSCEDLPDCSGGCRGEAYERTNCFSAGSPYCPQHTIEDMNALLPNSCGGCELEDFGGCSLESK